jgi:hypothetical protein
MRENLAIIHRVHPVVPPLRHLHDLLLLAHHLALHLVQIKIVGAKIYQLAVALATVVAQPEMSAQVVKPAIHGGFGPLRKIATNRVSVLEFLNQIFQMRLLEKS